mgnify:CR=1 FL=1
MDLADAYKDGDYLGTLVYQVLQEAGFTLPVDVEQLSWRGTAKLTRKTSPVAAGRVLVLGDASGYVEPFTGEGMRKIMHDRHDEQSLFDAAVDRRIIRVLRKV